MTGHDSAAADAEPVTTEPVPDALAMRPRFARAGLLAVVFVCAACERAGETGALPPMLTSPGYIVRGYSDAERIVYGTGGVVPTQDVPARCEELLARADIAFVHVRSASNNCFQVRVDRA